MSRDRALRPWSDFEAASPELAAFGRERLGTDGPNYLATVRGDGLSEASLCEQTTTTSDHPAMLAPNNDVNGMYELRSEVAADLVGFEETSCRRKQRPAREARANSATMGP